MPLDMSKYLSLFVAEAGDHLEALGRELIRLEREASPEAVDSLFRHAHSVKGLAASMGFEQTAVLAHRVEDLVEQVRKNPSVFSPEVADVLLASADQLQAMVRAVGVSRPEPDATSLSGRIAEHLVALTGAAPGPTRVLRTTVAPAALPPAAPKAPEADPSRTVRVRAEVLDDLLEVAGELKLATSRLRELSRDLPEARQASIDEGVDRLRGVVNDLHAKVMGVRLTPLSVVTDRLPRAARDLARRKGLEVDLSISGAEIELDRAILDELADPLLHLLRNCIDHGMEEPGERAAQGKERRGRVEVRARRERGRVVLEVEDDGRGMDAERLKVAAVERGLLSAEVAAALSERDAWLLAFHPGVSTAPAVTDLSGRGVGMDAVKRAVESVGGALEIESVPGRGTRFTLRVPLALAVVEVLLVEVGAEVLGLPIGRVRAVVEADPAGLPREGGAPGLVFGGALLPARSLGELLDLPRAAPGGVRPYLVLDAAGGPVAVEVDLVLGREEAVLKPLSGPLEKVSCLAGATILGNGRPVFILYVPRLFGP